MKLTNRAYGIEIEFTYKTGMSVDAQRNEIEAALQAAGLNMHAEEYNHSTKSYWKLIYDMSAGHELVSPILRGEDGFRQIELVAKVLNNLGYSVDKSCGLHVHHDARDLSSSEIKAIYAVSIKWESVIDWLVAPSRRNNQYCASLNRHGQSVLGTKVTLSELRRTSAGTFAHSFGRYVKVNYEAYLRHGTIEFRQHQGTLDAEKMITWIIITQNIITKAIEKGASYTVTQTSVCFKRFRDMLGCCGSLLEDNAYVKMASKKMLERWKHFTKGTGFGLYTPTLSA